MKLIAIVLALILSPVALHAQAPAPRPAELTPAVRGEVVDSLRAAVLRFYAVADTAGMIADHLQKRQAAGAYDGIADRARLADALTTDLRVVNGDRHLSVSPAPVPGAIPLGETRLPELQFGAPPPGFTGERGARLSTVPLTPEEAAIPGLIAARRSNFQMPKLEVLPGNVGYMEIRGFVGGAEAEERLVDALHFVEHTDALIIDVRDHRGGSAFMTNLLLSHFFGPEPVHYATVEVRGAGRRSETSTLPVVPGPRRPDVPLYVLIGPGTISASEGLAFALANTGRATLVGDTTYGAGRNNLSFDIGHGFSASISVSTVSEPGTGRQFEIVGVAPHVVVDPASALMTAHSMALDHVAAAEGDERRRAELKLIADAVRALDSAPVLPHAIMARFEGLYGGTERSISLEGGRLIYRRLPGTAGYVMVPLSETVFALESDLSVRLEFVHAGGTWAYRMTLPGRPAAEYPRTGNLPAR